LKNDVERGGTGKIYGALDGGAAFGFAVYFGGGAGFKLQASMPEAKAIKE
jgi:hypothetical protein